MVILKTTTLLIGLMAPSSASIDHVVVPSLAECKSFLRMEESRLRKGKGTIHKTPEILMAELKTMGVGMSVKLECITVK